MGTGLRAPSPVQESPGRCLSAAQSLIHTSPSPLLPLPLPPPTKTVDSAIPVLTRWFGDHLATPASVSPETLATTPARFSVCCKDTPATSPHPCQPASSLRSCLSLGRPRGSLSVFPASSTSTLAGFPHRR